MRLLRLRGRKVCDKLQRQGSLWRGKHLQIRWASGAPRHPSSNLKIVAIYAGTVASAKLEKSAVKRNRMRRRCREALRLTLKEMPDFPVSLQLLIAPRSSSLKAPFDALEQDINLFLSTHAPRQEKK